MGDQEGGLASNSAAQTPVPAWERGSVSASDNKCEVTLLDGTRFDVAVTVNGRYVSKVPHQS